MNSIEIGREVSFIDTLSGWCYIGKFLGYSQDQYNRKYATVGYTKLNGQNATAKVYCGRYGEAIPTMPAVEVAA
jgi:hypothetical protein